MPAREEPGPLGAWLFRHRGWLPVPLALAQLLLTEASHPAGLALILAGEGVRVAAAGHIGRPSRTRDASVGALVAEGPYARLRNPLYVGNVAMAAGFGWLASPWLGLCWLGLSSLFYAVVVRWEEGRLLQEHGVAFRAYCQRVPRWLPLGAARAGDFSLRKALSSERGTLLVWTVVLVLSQI